MNALAQIQQHWNAQAASGATAGTPDLLLKELEQRALLQALGELPHARTAIELGCGLGETARLVVAQYPQLDLIAIDRAGEMITQARRTEYPHARLRFRVGDVLSLPVSSRADVIYSQRCLINLPTWDLQKQALDEIALHLVPGGRYLMCEHSQQGLAAINRTRVALGLTAIEPPWHNRYLNDDELADVQTMRLVECRPFSATYYFLSRIVNAKLADQQGKAPQYDAPINRLARHLDHAVDPKWAQGRLWIWEKP